MRANALVVMTKAPEPGRSKTRLVPPLSDQEAADLARALLLDQLENLAQFNAAQRFIAFTPDSAAGFFHQFAARGFTPFAQEGGSLGERMSRAFEHLFACGFDRVVLLGADLPVVPLEFLQRAYASLDGAACDVVLGPSEDGGYYLIGMKRLIAAVFADIAWSRDDVLARTAEKLSGRGLHYELLSSWYDIDTAEDLRRLQAHGDRYSASMKNTFSLLNELRHRGKV